MTLVYTHTPDGLRVRQTLNGVETTYARAWASSVPELLLHPPILHPSTAALKLVQL